MSSFWFGTHGFCQHPPEKTDLQILLWQSAFKHSWHSHTCFGFQNSYIADTRHDHLNSSSLSRAGQSSCGLIVRAVSHPYDSIGCLLLGMDPYSSSPYRSYRIPNKTVASILSSILSFPANNQQVNRPLWGLYQQVGAEAFEVNWSWDTMTMA